MQLTLLIDPPQDGLTNMAVDEALLGMAAAGEIGPVLRFYEWAPATLSLGYFQRYAERAEHSASTNCAVVRRASGGGAILHERELTYSLVLPAGRPLTARAEPLYRAAHQTLIDALAERGLDACFWDDVRPVSAMPSDSATALFPQVAFACGESAEQPAQTAATSQSSRPREPFLCFQRRSPGDLVMRHRGDSSTTAAAWHKILGSAQRRRHGAVLQHGSLLWARSSFAPELPGVFDLSGTDFADHNYLALIQSWSMRFSGVLDFEIRSRISSSALVTGPRLVLAREKFHESGWLHSR